MCLWIVQGTLCQTRRFSQGERSYWPTEREGERRIPSCLWRKAQFISSFDKNDSQSWTKFLCQIICLHCYCFPSVVEIGKEKSSVPAYDYWEEFVYLVWSEKSFTPAWDMSITGGLVRMALTAEIQSVVTYDGFSTRSQPILYSSLTSLFNIPDQRWANFHWRWEERRDTVTYFKWLKLSGRVWVKKEKLIGLKCTIKAGFDTIVFQSKLCW